MPAPIDLAIVIPCYNEASRLPVDGYRLFLRNDAHTQLVFVNDGSVDTTKELLDSIKNEFDRKVMVLHLATNVGKANAVHAGINQVLAQHSEIPKIAFLDADLATSLEDCRSLSLEINSNVMFVFGSRIKKIDNEINRRLFRHLAGRVIATVISNLLKLSVYDTQCGCKIFDRKTAAIAFKDAFVSRWLFDVEIFFRLRQNYTTSYLRQHVREIPLPKWVDKDGSKIKLSYSLGIWIDLLKIKKTYHSTLLPEHEK